MKNIKTILSGMLLMGCLTAAAQEPASKTVYDFQPHWYVQLQAGGQHTIGEVDFADLLSPNAQVALGYNFTPVVGARLNVNAWQSKGGLKSYGLNKNWKWNYVAPQVDLMFNLSNLFAGYNPTRVFNLSLFGGLGANIAFSNKEAQDAKAEFIAARSAYDATQGQANQAYAHEPLEYLWDGTKTRLVGQLGLAADFRLSDVVSLGLELSANTLSDHYNSKNGGNTDWYYNALVGVKINLGQTYTSRVVEAPKPQVIVKEVVKEVPVQQPQPQVQQQLTQTATNATVDVIRREIFFNINTFTIKKADEQKVKDIVDFLNQHPAAKVTVEGYADKGTGNANVNYRLAGKRAASVVTMLKKMGISADRIVSVNKGDKEQPFPINEKNRVSICVAQ